MRFAFDIPDEHRGGNCFEEAWNNQSDFYLHEGIDEPMICHGIATGAGPLAGTEFTHGWNEYYDEELDGVYVIDTSNGNDLRMPAWEYYMLMGIDSGSVHRYNSEEACQEASRTMKYGPWAPELQFEYREARTAFDVPDEHRGGNCFEVALRNVMDDGPNGTMLLCHGVVTGQGPLSGIRFTHAWNEIGGYVLDESNGNSVLTPVDNYYAIGDIDPDEVFKYDFREMGENVLMYGTYGPWEPELDFEYKEAGMGKSPVFTVNASKCGSWDVSEFDDYTIYADQFSGVEAWVESIDVDGGFSWGVFDNGSSVAFGNERNIDDARSVALDVAQRRIDGMPLGYDSYSDKFFDTSLEERMITSQQAGCDEINGTGVFASSRKIAKSVLPPFKDFEHQLNVFGEDIYVYDDGDLRIKIAYYNSTWNWEISDSSMPSDIFAISLVDCDTPEEAWNDLYERAENNDLGWIWLVPVEASKTSYVNQWGVETPSAYEVMEGLYMRGTRRTTSIDEDDDAWNPGGLSGDDFDPNDSEQMAFPYLDADYSETGSFDGYGYELNCHVHVEEGRGFCDSGLGDVSATLKTPSGDFRMEQMEVVVAAWFSQQAGGHGFWSGEGDDSPLSDLDNEVGYVLLFAEEIAAHIAYDRTMAEQRAARRLRNRTASPLIPTFDAFSEELDGFGDAYLFWADDPVAIEIREYNGGWDWAAVNAYDSMDVMDQSLSGFATPEDAWRDFRDKAMADDIYGAYFEKGARTASYPGYYLGAGDGAMIDVEYDGGGFYWSWQSDEGTDSDTGYSMSYDDLLDDIADSLYGNGFDCGAADVMDALDPDFNERFGSVRRSRTSGYSRQDFIDLEIVPTLGGYEDDFDLDGIFDEVAEYSGDGFVWKGEYDRNPSLYYDLLGLFEKSAHAKTATRQFTYAEMEELDREIEGRELHNRSRLKAFAEEALW